MGGLGSQPALLTSAGEMGDDGWQKIYDRSADVGRAALSPAVKLKEDAGLREKLLDVGDLDAAVAMAKQDGFDVSKADWIKYQAKQALEMSDDELANVAGGEVCVVSNANSGQCHVFGSSIFGYC